MNKTNRPLGVSGRWWIPLQGLVSREYFTVPTGSYGLVWVSGLGNSLKTGKMGGSCLDSASRRLGDTTRRRNPMATGPSGLGLADIEWTLGMQEAAGV